MDITLKQQYSSSDANLHESTSFIDFLMGIAQKAHFPDSKVLDHMAQISVLNDDLIVSFRNTKSLRDLPPSSEPVVRQGPYGIQILSRIIDALEVR